MQGLRFALIISLICHAVIFSSVELTFGKKAAEKNLDFTEIFFLGPILQAPFKKASKTAEEPGYPRKPAEDALSALLPSLSETYGAIPESAVFKKPGALNLIENKIAYFKPASKIMTKETDSSIMFSPLMPYHFLLYFRDRQTAHMEVAFYLSPEGKIAGLKRKISSGNPEVDLLIMRNLTHFLNLCKSNFKPSSWQTVKIDLSP